MTASNQHIEGSMQSFWQSLSSLQSSSSLSSSSFSSIAGSSWRASRDSVHWMIENRGGMAKITGSLIVPSQFLGPNLERTEKNINTLCEQNSLVKRISFKDVSGNSLNGVICYPVGWKSKDDSRCVIYHNPNGITVPQFFENNELFHTPAEILRIKKCPVILYDYRGTGLNQGNLSSSVRFRPTYETVVQDGLAALTFALKSFKHVDVWGSSLGGGVATASLERHLNTKPFDTKRVTLTNHDSFTTTPRVVMPGVPRLADTVGWVVGGSLDAQTPMQRLLQRGVKVTVLCHLQDPVIPQGARMAEFLASSKFKNRPTLIYSDEYGHANLSLDLVRQLSARRSK